MNCDEIRQLIPSVSRGHTSLTEWALVEGHLKRCTGCQAERQRVEAEVSRVTPTWVRRLADSFIGLAERVPNPAAGLTALPARLGHRLRVPATRAFDTAGRTAASARAWTVAARTWSTSSATEARRAAEALLVRRAELHAWISTAPAHAHRRFRTVVSITHTSARGRAHEVIDLGRAQVGRAGTSLGAGLALARARAERARAAATAILASMAQIKAVQVGGIAVAVTLALYVLLPTPILRPDGGSEVAIAHHARPRPDVVGAGARRGSDPAPPRLATARSTAIVATTSAQSPRRAGPHVIGRLTVRDRDSSDQEITALLARSGGARIGGRHELATTTIVHAVVPSSGYRKFVRGLAEIGSWQVEAERAPLPQGIRMTIRMAD
ncbi:MAG TPA: hypothetical protein VID28_05385 [Methylomirabilota bacterium]|jgi:hypothetical protein